MSVLLLPFARCGEPSLFLAAAKIAPTYGAPRMLFVLVLMQDDLQPFIRELLLYHPGLEFLEAHPDFHPKYATTVTTRIFYIVNTRWEGTCASLAQKNFQSDHTE